MSGSPSPERDSMSPGSGKLLDKNDKVFDETAYLESQGQTVQGGQNAVEEDTLTTGNSPLTFDVFDDLGVNGGNGYVTNDSTAGSPASMTVEISHDGSSFDTGFTLLQGETFSLYGRNVSKIRLTRISTDCPFRINAY